MIQLCKWMGRWCDLSVTPGGPAVNNQQRNPWELFDKRIGSGMEYMSRYSLDRIKVGECAGFPVEDSQLISLVLFWDCENHCPGELTQEFLDKCEYLK